MADPLLMDAILKEIHALEQAGITPVTSDVLRSGETPEVLECLLALKKQGGISGDLISEALTGKPRRMTRINLTFTGLRMLRETKPPFSQ